MKQRSKKLTETKVFDNYAEARDMVDTAERKRVRILIGLGLAAVATVFTLVGFNVESVDWLAGLGILLALPAYLIGGGIGSALKAAWNLGVLGWIIAPFPYDIVTGVFTFLVAGLGFFCTPALFVLMNFVKHERDYKEAQRYLSYFRDIPAEGN